ncbi:MAG: hypothetical protein ACKVIN_09960 [Longimicrobiales bacterium]
MLLVRLLDLLCPSFIELASPVSVMIFLVTHRHRFDESTLSIGRVVIGDVQGPLNRCIRSGSIGCSHRTV